jgi:Fe-S oxidoreductase
MALTGAKVTVVERCSGIDGTWGYRKENYAMAKKVIAPLVRAIESAPGDGVCGDCHLANTAILEETGTKPLHPVQFLARAYGIGNAKR